MRTLLFWLFLVTSPAQAAPLDLNGASAEQLAALPGLGPSKAAAIVVFRSENGPFETVEALDAVPGIGPATVKNLEGLVRVGPVVVPTEVPDVSTAPGATGLVDPNTAAVDRIATLPGISPLMAEEIVADRDRNGPFPRCEDLVRVRGLGPATVAGLVDLCTTGPAGPE